MARRDITMSEKELLEFLISGHTVCIGTNGPDGHPHVAPMWYAIVDGKIVFRSFTKSQKIVNLMRDPRMTALVEAGRSYQELRGVMIKGEAHLETSPDFVLGMYGKLAAKYAMVGGRPQELSTEELESAFGRYATKNTAVMVEPAKVVSWDHTKLGDVY